MKLEVLAECCDHESLIHQWDEILAQSVSARLFESPLWVLNYWRYRCGAKNALSFITGRDEDGRMVAILPFVKKPQPGAPFLSTWECAHSTGEYESNWTCHPDYAGRFASALLDHLNSHRHLWYQMKMTVVREDSSALTALLPACRQSGFSIISAPGREVPFIPITDSASLEDVVDGKYRREMRRRQNKLEKVNPLKFELYCDQEGLDPALDEFFAVEASGWKGRGGSAIRDDDSAERFWRQLSHDAARRRQLRLHLLRSGDGVIAGQLGIVFAKTYYCLKIGYDDRYGEFGPGALTTREAVRHCLEDPQIDVYDFAGAALPYMRNWTDRTYRTWSIQIGSTHAALGGVFDLVRHGRGTLRSLRRAITGRNDNVSENT